MASFNAFSISCTTSVISSATVLRDKLTLWNNINLSSASSSAAVIRYSASLLLAHPPHNLSVQHCPCQNAVLWTLLLTSSEHICPHVLSCNDARDWPFHHCEPVPTNSACLFSPSQKKKHFSFLLKSMTFLIYLSFLSNPHDACWWWHITITCVSCSPWPWPGQANSRKGTPWMAVLVYHFMLFSLKKKRRLLPRGLPCVSELRLLIASWARSHSFILPKGQTSPTEALKLLRWWLKHTQFKHEQTTMTSNKE